MKKFLAVLLCGAMLASFAVGCGKKDNNEQNPSGENQVIDETTFDKVIESVKEEYGEYYLPNVEMDEERFVEVTGIDMENVERFYAEEPMIGTQVDKFIAIKAKDGKGADVEADLNAYRDVLVNDSLQYPINEAKVESSEVVRYGDYVYFVMLGKYDERDDVDDESALEFAKKETKRGLDKIASFFNM